MTDQPQDDRDDARQQCESEYAAWCAEQDEDDEINRMLEEVNNADK